MPLVQINNSPTTTPNFQVQNPQQQSPVSQSLPTLNPVATTGQAQLVQNNIQPQVPNNQPNFPNQMAVASTPNSSIQNQPISNLPQQNLAELMPKQDLGTIDMKVFELNQIIHEAVKREASDIHLTTDYRAMLRVEGDLLQLPTEKISKDVMRNYVEQLLSLRPDISMDNLKQVDLSYAFENRRFRVNIFREMGNFAIVMRLIPQTIKTINDLNLPNIFHEFALVPAGLILLTGPTGSGKSTTLASIINEINVQQRKHIITIEDPIEFVYPEGQSIFEQRELGLDFDTFPHALRALLRQDPNVVLVGEMRDYETIAGAITVSETGHLVFATLHTNSAAQSVDRIIDVFPEAQQAQIRSQLANVLTAVVSQRLVKRVDGKRIAVHEILIANPAVKNAIRENKTFQIDNMIQTGQDFGMVSMEKSLVEMIRKGEITKDAALKVTIKPKELEILLNKF